MFGIVMQESNKVQGECFVKKTAFELIKMCTYRFK